MSNSLDNFVCHRCGDKLDVEVNPDHPEHTYGTITIVGHDEKVAKEMIKNRSNPGCEVLVCIPCFKIIGESTSNVWSTGTNQPTLKEMENIRDTQDDIPR